jgi:hypothetical protein
MDLSDSRRGQTAVFLEQSNESSGFIKDGQQSVLE